METFPSYYPRCPTQHKNIVIKFVQCYYLHKNLCLTSMKNTEAVHKCARESFVCIRQLL